MRREGMNREAIGEEQTEGVNGQQGNKQPAWEQPLIAVVGPPLITLSDPRTNTPRPQHQGKMQTQKSFDNADTD